MIFEPIVRAKLNNFKEKYELNGMVDGIAFERFTNHTILTTHQPDAFTTENELIDLICVGGSNDMGIDGIAIKLNGIFIRSIQDIDDILSSHKKKSNFEFIFIQSKYKNNFDSQEFGAFKNGVTDFLSNTHFQPRNEKVSYWLDVKDYILSDDIMIDWEVNPSVRLYYVVVGKWEESPHILGLSEQFKSDIINLNTYGNIDIHYVDSKMLTYIIDCNDNSFSEVFSIIDSMSLTEVNDVSNSSLVLCYADELIRLLKTDDGLIRKNLFDDNVRDFQGDTTINSEMYDTIKTYPESFMLLNNGITIVCDEVTLGNRKITVKNPQIVNGCQTSNVLFNAYKKGLDLSKVPVSLKIISTDKDHIINKIVKGTNKQNIVYDEAFEITRDFHKNLEKFFLNEQIIKGQERIYYERRSKQYANNPSVKASQKINFRILIQSFVGTFLNAPNLSHRHEKTLLEKYQNKIFIENQSMYPYYIASLIHVKFEKLFRESIINKKELYTYRAHIIMIFRELAAGPVPNINKESDIDQYCKKIHSVVNDEVLFAQYAIKAVDCFVNIKNKWIEFKGESYKYGIKDSAEFLQFVISELSTSEYPIDTEKFASFRGTVIDIKIDRNGFYYGFISRKSDDIFFHSVSNKDLNFKTLLDCEVIYTIDTNPVNGKERAVNVKLVKSM